MDDAVRNDNAAPVGSLPSSARPKEGDALRRRPRTQRTAVLVVGMHRSGTSALTRVLNFLGCDLPKTLVAARAGSETGYWESEKIVELNEAMLASAGADVSDCGPIGAGWFDSPKLGEFKQRAQDTLDEEFGESRLFVLKDPRLCRLLPVWLDVLNAAAIRPSIIIPVRNPVEVASSLGAREAFHAGFGHLLWLRHVLDAEAASRGQSRFFCSYDDLLTSWPWLASRAQDTLGVTFPRLSERAAEDIGAFLSDDWRHHRVSRDSVIHNPLLSPWVRRSFEILSRWAVDGENADDYAALDRIRTDFDAASPAFAHVVLSGQRAAQDVRVRDQEIVRISGERDAVAGESTRLRSLLSESEAERSQIGGHVATLQAALQTERETTAAEISRLSARAQEIEASGAQVAEQLTSERNFIATEASQLRARLSKAVEDANDRATTAERLNQALMSAQEKLSAGEDAVAQAEASAASARDASSAAESKLAAIESRLAETEGALAAARETLARTEAAAAQLSRTAQQAEQRAAKAVEDAARVGATAAETEARFGEATREIAAMTRLMQEQEGEARRAGSDLSEHRRAAKDAQEKLSAAERALATSRAQASETQSRLTVSFSEIAEITRLLRDQEYMTLDRDAQAEWMRRVAATLLAGGSGWRGRVFQLLPGFVMRAWMMRHLKSQGLFDAEAYMRAYPDVAQSGGNALRHYIYYGAKEGRARR